MNISLPTFIASTQSASEPAATGYYVPWERWLEFKHWENDVRALAILLLILLLGAVLSRIFKKFLHKYKLERPTRWVIVTAAIYFALIAFKPYRMVDHFDVLSLVIHKTFAAILLIVAVRYLDRLIVLPLLTRIGKSAPSRFVHQIVLAVISVFVIAGYCSWAFNIEISSFLAGSAVISIVLGLALQETLGNFFSGMVLQASVPFQPGDWIQIGDVEGRVIEMTWRAVTLLTKGNNNILIPNSTVAKEKIVNFHYPSVATTTTISVGLDYSLPPNDAKRALAQAAKDARGVLPEPEPSVLLASFDDSAITYKVVFWIDQPQQHGIIEERVRSNVWYRLNQAGYNIPFPVRTVELARSDKKAAAAENSARAQRLATIRQSPLFSALSPELQETLAAETRDFLLAAGQTFYRQNDPGKSLFILQAGTVSITIHDAAGRDLNAGEVAAPAVFGEISAMTSQPRGATVLALTDVRAMEVDQNHLQKLFSHDPNLMTHFSNVVAQRQKQRDDLLQQLGAATAQDPQHAQPDSVLDRMKRLFTRHIRST